MHFGNPVRLQLLRTRQLVTATSVPSKQAKRAFRLSLNKARTKECYLCLQPYLKIRSEVYARACTPAAAGFTLKKNINSYPTRAPRLATRIAVRSHTRAPILQGELVYYGEPTGLQDTNGRFLRPANVPASAAALAAGNDNCSPVVRGRARARRTAQHDLTVTRVPQHIFF